MQTETIRYEESQLRIEGAIAEFSHQQPKARNPMTMVLREDYVKMLERLRGDLEVRVLILTGSEGSFCAGGDIKGMERRLTSTDPNVNSPDATRRRLEDAHRWLTPLRDIDIPVVAAVDGPAYGAGFSLALQADFVMASSRATFCMSFARLGAVPDFGALSILPRIVGLARAKELMITARRVSALEGQAMGFVHSVHEASVLLPSAHAFAAKLAAGPREATAMTKNLLNRSFETDYTAMCSLEAYAQAVAMQTPYHAEAAARFKAGQASVYDWDGL